ncbi:hypothetical protein [Leptolyngbya sp. FACHB-261]|uniref:hypothetical protein n=1 Tax=Leptolyngbya sp. FACHB-261 TaxID=2692806 RepID=UPI0016826EE9|nr:hypothetical protein [Leptolyngbya sp. FACHB-261]MBD2100489.1 hypothetical protein [Leptolyngbya sp. FACHB-261]
MTATGEFISSRETVPQREPTKVFGVEITPTVGGVVLGLLGLGLTAYFTANYTMPKFEELSQINSQIDTTEQEVNAQREGLKNIDQIRRDIQTARAQNQQVLGLFSDEKAVNSTLLLDFNRKIVESSGAQLIRYVPVTADPQAPANPALGGKVREQAFTVEIQGTFGEILSTLRNLERLQTLTEVQSLNMTPVDQPPGAGLLRATFNLVAYVPLSAEEIAAQAAATPAPGQTPAPGASPAPDANASPAPSP